MKQHVLTQHYIHSDRVMLYINYGLCLTALALASWYNTWLEAIFIGGGTAIALSIMYSLAKGNPICRVAMASGLMLFAALHIHQAHGMIEFHFGIFALLAMLLFYRDWLPIITAAGFIATHHLSFYYIQASGADIWVLPSAESGIGIIFLHALYVVIETALLVWFSVMLKKEALESTEIMNTTNRILESEIIDLTQRTSGKTVLLQKFNHFTSSIESLAQQVQQSSGRLNTQGTELNTIISALQNAANSQQSETDMIATAVEEMSSAIHEVTRNAELAADSSSDIDQKSQEATQVSQSTQTNVKILADKVSEAVKTIESLNEHAHNIGSVLGVIRGIAEQTNLLALNAAIEAARAGDQGRGFAVVADEVRTLALRTQQSTQEIDNMIELLQNGSNQAVKAIESSRTQANDCVLNTVNALEIMESVSASIRDIHQMNAMIASAANEQSTVTGEISRNISNILEASRHTAENACGAVTSAHTMEEIARELDKTTTRFKLG